MIEFNSLSKKKNPEYNHNLHENNEKDDFMDQ